MQNFSPEDNPTSSFSRSGCDEAYLANSTASTASDLSADCNLTMNARQKKHLGLVPYHRSSHFLAFEFRSENMQYMCKF